MTGCVLQECSTGSCYTDKSLITSSHKTSTDSLTMSVIIFHIAWIWKGTQGAQTSAKADPQFCRIQRKRSDCAHKNGMGPYFAHAPPLQEGWCNSITFATELQLILVTNKQTNRQTAKLNKDLWRGFLWLHKHTMTHRNLDFITCAKHVQPPTLWLTCNDISPSPCRWAATSAGVMSLLGGGSGRGLRCSRRLLSFL